jgi:nitrous oxidase accessory protein NosD
MNSRILRVTTFEVFALFAVGVQCPSYSKTIEVRCALPGDNLTRALERADPGDVISIRGTCDEKVTIKTDHITLDGHGTAIVRGTGGPGDGSRLFDALITIDGAQGVSIKGLRVEASPAEGILAQNGAAISLLNIASRSNTVGLAVASGSTAELVDSTIDGNLAGVGVLTDSSLILKGRVSVINNQDHGFDITGNSTVEIRGAQVNASNNARHGMTFDGSRLILLGILNRREVL